MEVLYVESMLLLLLLLLLHNVNRGNRRKRWGYGNAPAAAQKRQKGPYWGPLPWGPSYLGRMV